MTNEFKEIIGKLMFYGIDFNFYNDGGFYFVKDTKYPERWEIDDSDSYNTKINLWSIENDYETPECHNYTEPYLLKIQQILTNYPS